MFLHIYYSYVLSLYITSIGINPTMNKVPDESAMRKLSIFIRWKLSIFIRCNSCRIYSTKNSLDASTVEFTALYSSLINYNHSFLLRKPITWFYDKNTYRYLVYGYTEDSLSMCIANIFMKLEAKYIVGIFLCPWEMHCVLSFLLKLL